MYTISSIIDVVTGLGWSVIPVGLNKKPLFSWKQYQQERASVEQINQWQKQYNPPAWAVITGSISNLIILDGDGEPGRNTFELLGLDPHRRTGSGGLHCDFEHPGWFVPTLNSKSKIELGERWPGLDIRGDGGYAVFCGKNTSGEYVWLRAPGELDSLDILPDDLRIFLGLLNPPQEKTSRPVADIALERALRDVSITGRDNACFKLAKQLHDNSYSQVEAESICMEFARRAPTHNTKGKVEPFTEATARAKVASAYSYTKRDPWSSTTTYSQEHPQSGNGSNPPESNINLDSLRTYVDERNTERLIERHGKNLRYCAKWKKWLVWDGRRWCISEAEKVISLAKETIRAMYVEALDIDDDERKRTMLKHIMRSDKISMFEAMERSARADLLISPDDLDKNNMLFNVLNGTLDLGTYTFRKHNRADLITRLAPVVYDPNATCPLWTAFFDRFFPENPDLQAFIQRIAGYCLTGDTSEKATFIGHGGGNNGKSTLLNTLMTMMGDYADQIATETLMVKRYDKAIANDIAKLKGLRLVIASEGEEGQRLAESKIKQMSGGSDHLVGEFKYGEEFTFIPTHKIFLGTNHLPQIRGTDPAIWNRLKLIPFAETIDPSEADLHYIDKLKAELSGILNWALAGNKNWRAQGIGRNPDVEKSTASHRAEMDILRHFLEDRCVIKKNCRVAISELYKAYVEWCDKNTEIAFNTRRFRAALLERGFTQDKDDKERFWRGIGLLDSDKTDNPDTNSTKVPYVKNVENSFSKTQSDLSETSGKSDRSAAPDRACLHCGTRNWQWDSLLERYTCGSCNHG